MDEFREAPNLYVPSSNMFLFVCDRREKQEAPMTMRIAVNNLYENSTEKQVIAANFIQNQCFSSAEAKKMVSKFECGCTHFCCILH